MSTASTRSTNKIISISAVYWEYGAYSDHLSVYRRFDNIIRILLQTAFIVGGWSHEWELKQITFGGGTRVLRLLAVFREYMLRALEISTGSTLLILLGTPTISDVCAAGTACCTRGSVLSQYSQYLRLHYSYCSYSQHAQYLGRHKLEYCNTLSTSSIQSIEPRNTASTGSLRKKVSNTIHTNMYHAAPTHLPTIVLPLCHK